MKLLTSTAIIAILAVLASIGYQHFFYAGKRRRKGPKHRYHEDHVLMFYATVRPQSSPAYQVPIFGREPLQLGVL